MGRKFVLAVLFILFWACTSPEYPELKDGVLVTFDVQGERYKIFITNKKTIDDVYAVLDGQSRARIPNGLLVKGQVSYNKPWSWHIDSEDIQMAESCIELCDGLPSSVEQNLDDWLETVKRFCPWSARIVDVDDYR